MVETGDFERADIFINPPDGDQSDEDSGEEDGPGPTDNLFEPELANLRVAQQVPRVAQQIECHLESVSVATGVRYPDKRYLLSHNHI